MGRILLLAILVPFLISSCCALGSDVQVPFPRPKPPTAGKAPPGKVFKRSSGEEIPPYNTVYYFDQLIDHNNASRGTFKQRYWHTAEFYEPGGPIILYSPGETNAERSTSRLTNSSVTGYMAQRFNGATVVLEHRFYGFSNPVQDLKGSTLAKYHTIEQAVGDLEYFVKNVKLPMGVGKGKVPWILAGCSYMGSLTAWTMAKKPGLFHAGWSSSAPVQPIYNFWRYFEPIREYMPKNCSADVEAVIAHVDKTIGSNDKTQIQKLKAGFGMSNVTNVDDFVTTLTRPLWGWQEITPDSGPKTKFGEFCDALEVDEEGKHAPKEGWGVKKALDAWGNYYKDTYLKRLCGGDIGQCLNTRPANATVDIKSINTTIDNEDRSWRWFVCNEVGWHQVGSPADEKTPRLVSQYRTTEYSTRYCKLNFPDAPTDGAKGVNKTISTYGGWNLKADRMVSVVGRRDPWREATLGASTLNRTSTDRMPIIFATGGTHCSDLTMGNGEIDSTIGFAISKGLEYMQKWMEEWEGDGKTTGIGSSDKSNDDDDEASQSESESEGGKSQGNGHGGLHELKGWEYRVWE
ncbi:hypothetical protein PM082_007137 [Marasmius tenuissimus]|nr:hypothetical protein PM082_007137 [Marasmius tenuissimus]